MAINFCQIYSNKSAK